MDVCVDVVSLVVVVVVNGVAVWVTAAVGNSYPRKNHPLALIPLNFPEYM